MNALIIGATGFIGTAVDEALSARGHHTTGTARSESARAKLDARGTAVVRADASQPQTLEAAIKAADAVVYAVSVTDAEPAAVDSRALRAVRKALAGTEKTFVYVSNAWVYGDTGDEPATETTRPKPPAMLMRRLEIERAALEMTQIGIRAIVVRPGIAYGRAGGIPVMFVQSARARGAATIVGDGFNRWATVGIRDLGEFIALAVERGLPGRPYNAVNADRFTQMEIAAAASRGAGALGATTHAPEEMMGRFGQCLALDQTISADRARETLGWEPHDPSIIEELETGSYTELAGTALAS
jgi:nucleoside-diphosphate-sugar epimerase